MKGQKNIIKLIIVVSVILVFVSNLEPKLILREGYVKEQSLPPGEWSAELVLPYRATQPDGTIIILEEVIGGKNNLLSFIRLNGYTVAKDDSKLYSWAIQGELGNLVPTGYAIHLYDPEELGLEKDIRFSDELAERLKGWQIRGMDPNRRD